MVCWRRLDQPIDPGQNSPSALKDELLLPELEWKILLDGDGGKTPGAHGLRSNHTKPFFLGWFSLCLTPLDASIAMD